MGCRYIVESKWPATAGWTAQSKGLASIPNGYFSIVGRPVIGHGSIGPGCTVLRSLAYLHTGTVSVSIGRPLLAILGISHHPTCMLRCHKHESQATGFGIRRPAAICIIHQRWQELARPSQHQISIAHRPI